MKKTPVKGTNDYTPREAALRDRLKQTILDVYVKNGFEHIYTPAVEDSENLNKSEGGENLSLIFNILKRGDKLDKLIEEGVTKENASELSDIGLRYDLTLPLTRFYANNRNDLLSPLKCIQIDRVYRAERPQKGRLREFIQCDIDILGSESPDCETELILTTVTALEAIGLKNFTVRINDRRLLYAVLMQTGFEEKDLESVCISFDKLDKIGAEGVCAELSDKGFDAATVERFRALLDGGELTLSEIKEKLDDKTPAESLEGIIADVQALSVGRADIEFDLSLVRGQGYYTGTVFEVVSKDFKGSVAGGGRYDKLIGKFIGEDVPAVGFSIGFERIYSILSESEEAFEKGQEKIAILYNAGDFKKAYKEAEKLRAEGKSVSLFERPKKTGKFIDKIKEHGFSDFILSE